jgi:cytidine deaminase
MQKLDFAELPAEIQLDILSAEQETEHSFPSNRSTKIGAVLSTENKKFTGANIRRRAFSSSTCAERMVIDQALYAGAKHLQHLVVFGKSSTDVFKSSDAGMCGLCRQILADALSELGQKDVQVIFCGQEKKDVIVATLRELFPLAYEKAESQAVA